MDFKQWSRILGNHHALDQWSLDAWYVIFLVILDACQCLLNNFDDCRGITYWLPWACRGTFRREFGPCCLWHAQSLWSQGSCKRHQCRQCLKQQHHGWTPGEIAAAGFHWVESVGYLVTCMKYLPCAVIYLLYLVHISHNLFPSCCQRCTTQIVPTMCYYIRNNYFLLIYWVFQLYPLPYYTIHQGLSIHQISFPYLTFLYLFFFPTPMARKVSYTEIKLKKFLGISDLAKVRKCGKRCQPHTGTATLILSCLILR